jgi:hypothetical protein
VNGEYLHDVEEGLYLEDGEVNYSFEEDIKYAYKFGTYRDMDSVFFAPKYLWDDRKNIPMKTAQDMIDYFGGEFLEVTETIVKTYDIKKI